MKKLIVSGRDGKIGEGFMYLIIRVDGFNFQERAKQIAEKYHGYAASADKKSKDDRKCEELDSDTKIKENKDEMV